MERRGGRGGGGGGGISAPFGVLLPLSHGNDGGCRSVSAFAVLPLHVRLRGERKAHVRPGSSKVGASCESTLALALAHGMPNRVCAYICVRRYPPPPFKRTSTLFTRC